MNCLFVQSDNDAELKTCSRCSRRVRSTRPVEQCFAACHTNDPGAGTYLAQLFERAYIKDDGKCGCAELAQQMDRNGPDWCEANIDTIIGWLRENAGKRGLPFSNWLARGLLKRAIKQARAEHAKLQS